ncbi:hypothetical protein [Planktotalea sp.]|uniref:hypothetical protein n=1 Tax=Planktotalea sp. TaxID=2029877 RepID=UPI003F6CE2E4
MSTFFSSIPIWVFPLFLLLLILGLRASKTRRVPIAVIYALPLLGILTLNNIVSLEAPSWIWLMAALAYGIGIFFGMRWQKDWIISFQGRTVELQGEWITLSAMMLIFMAGFVNGFLTDTLPELTKSALFLVFFTAFTCAPAGQFLGRAITTLRSSR